ncbi:MAG: hypothetical protein V2I79_12250, partial [Xanthomonadales bacterium]|nr:hypothetical protein [Xanthomonadales bacterium]
MAADVLRVRDCDETALRGLLERFGLELRCLRGDTVIPGSYWGEAEAGLIENRVIVRPDTPVHSLLHEACHCICMDPERRCELNTDAGGDHDEENAVCYLQIVLADEITGMGSDRMMQDMDTWGYTFRLGSARAWFERDADDARQWLLTNGLLTAAG